jgi:hypothetical protein
MSYNVFNHSPNPPKISEIRFENHNNDQIESVENTIWVLSM